MSLLFVWMWVVGGVPAAVIGEVLRTDNPRIARVARIAFALLLSVDLLLAVVIFTTGQDAAAGAMSRGLWWFTIIAAGIPLALVSGLAVRRGYPGKRRIALAVATLMTAALYLAFPLGFIPRDEPKLTGLGRWEHDHVGLGIVILLIPTLILLVNELLWKQEEMPVSESDRESLRSGIARIPGRKLIGGGILVLAFIWMLGTNGPGLLVGIGVILAVLAWFAWDWHHSVMESVRRDLGPPESP
ncbi:MAG TPA: hypothetical protein VKB43_08405 [Gaiellaceae bacterium]|nr:hypothetical protein [Gaiellaceae bacterium]